MQNGYSKDNKFNQPQILLALLATTAGLPIGYEVYPGSTFEGHTLKDAIAKLRIKYELEQIIFTADSGLLSKTNLEYLDENGIKYIVGARLKNLSSDLSEQVTNLKTFREITGEENYEKLNTIKLTEDKKLIVTHSSTRAYKDKTDRVEAIEKLKIKLTRSNNPASLISNYGYKKFLKIEGTSKVLLRPDVIESAEKWDGLHGVITNVKDLSEQEIISQYHGLWQIEECFRISKHDLRVRPIYHWTPNRVRAHIAICFMALVCVRTMMYKMKLLHNPMSPRAIKKELLAVQVSILKHNKKDITYALPSNFSIEAESIYKIMGKKLNRCPYIIK
jgi:transposase